MKPTDFVPIGLEGINFEQSTKAQATWRLVTDEAIREFYLGLFATTGNVWTNGKGDIWINRSGNQTSMIQENS